MHEEHNDFIPVPEPKKIVELLFEARKNFSSVKKSQRVDIGRSGYNYANLEGFDEAIRPHLEKNNILLQQPPIVKDDLIGIKTIFTAVKTGEVLEYEFLPPAKYLATNQKGIQELGSLITYLRRYHLASILAIPTEDDDAHKATHGKSEVNNYNPMNNAQAVYQADGWSNHN